MSYFTGVLAIVLLLIVVVFSIQNLGSVEVSFLVWTMSIPKIMLILGTYVMGMLTGWGIIELIKRRLA